MSKPKMYANKIRIVLTQEVNVGPYISTALCLCFIAVYIGTHVGLYGSGPTLTSCVSTILSLFTYKSFIYMYSHNNMIIHDCSHTVLIKAMR